ncbi:hypothetical protein RvY_13516 [Ramazzottius varieornatus]|uniref:Peptidase S1 domain-containing protein n=1 Tax=Ramazzottius varieornatus TaxID=947166 RepID=A0A1D1VN55_RAMVA|nr:hypothetical protein RvY_13516 [Ramazzottius varieornatus]
MMEQSLFTYCRVKSWMLCGLICFCLFACSSANLVKLVSKCTTNSGIGRCAALTSSCMDMGGSVAEEIRLKDGSKALDSCSDEEVCCVLYSSPYRDTCTSCGRKGNEARVRSSNLERRMDVVPTVHLSKLRVLRDVQQDAAPYRQERILNGNDADKNEWCWQVALLNTDGTIIGSGSLLDGRYVVTAAHKVAGKNSSSLVVLVGQHDFSTPITAEANNTIWYGKPEEIIIHDKYNPETLDHNIALIRIPPIACSAANVCPLCLNDMSYNTDFMVSLSNCYITGWGATVSREASPVLQEARVRILSMEECVRKFAAVGLLDVVLPLSAFCAEGVSDWSYNTPYSGPLPVISTCSGDGGGPLVCEGGDGKWRLMGMIAMGVDDCQQTRISAPTVFVNAGMYNEWTGDVKARRGTTSQTVKMTRGIPPAKNTTALSPVITPASEGSTESGDPPRDVFNRGRR